MPSRARFALVVSAAACGRLDFAAVTPASDGPGSAGSDAAADHRARGHRNCAFAICGRPADSIGDAPALRHPCCVATDALSAIDATPFAGLIPWLASLVRRARDVVARSAPTHEERELLLLIEYVASRFGEPVLEAAGVDDLDDRLDALVASPDAMFSAALLARGSSLAQTSEPIDAWLDAQRQAARLIVAAHPVDPESIRAFSIYGPEIPAELAELAFHSLRASFCLLAMVQAMASPRHVEPWLAHAIVERFVASATEHLRLLASLPGVTVDESLVPAARRLDWNAIEARHALARATSARALRDTQARLGR